MSSLNGEIPHRAIKCYVFFEDINLFMYYQKCHFFTGAHCLIERWAAFLVNGQQKGTSLNKNQEGKKLCFPFFFFFTLLTHNTLTLICGH